MIAPLPRKRDIQYAAASKLATSVSGILDAPLSRSMTTELAAAYSAAVRISAFSARTAQNLNSGILPNGSSAGLVRRFAAASA